MDYSNIEKIISIDNYSEMYVDENDNFARTDPLDKVNNYLAKGWILLAIDCSPNDDHTSHILKYVLGFPKSNSTK